MTQQDRSRWRQFGRETRRLRELAGMTQRQLAVQINLHHTMLGSLERGTRTPKREHADTLDAALQTGGILRRLWQDLSAQRDVPDWFRSAVQLERRSREIKEYSPATIPGLLQTPGYAEALVKFRLPRATPDEIKEVVTGRTGRIRALRETTPLLWFIVRQSVLEQGTHAPATMHEQLDHIRTLASEGTIRIQVLPHSAPVAPPGTPFRVLTLSGTQTVAYVEHALGGETYDSPEQVGDLTTLFSALQAEALAPGASIDLIKTINGEHHVHVA
jgi:transcriptional regulator with XRE-family HTH domain